MDTITPEETTGRDPTHPPAAPMPEGKWGPLYALLFGAWFAPWPALAWGSWALSDLSGGRTALLGGVVIGVSLLLLVIAAALFIAARPTLQTPNHYGKGTFIAFWLVIAIECGVIGAVNVALTRAHHTEWIMPWIALVVGLHFLPLARINHNPLWYITGIALCTLVVTTVLVWPAAASLRVFGSAPTNRWHFIIAAGCAVIFWLTSATSALLTLRALNRTPRLSVR